MRRDKYEDERGSGGNGGSSWISYSDMMAALMLVFVLMLCVSLLKYFTAPKEEDFQQLQSIEERLKEIEQREADLAEREEKLAKALAELEKERAELKKAQEQLEKDRVELKKAQEQLAKDQAELKKAQEQLAKDQAELRKAQEQLTKDRAELKKAQEQLEKDRAELKKAQEQLEKDRAELRKAQEQLEKDRAELRKAQEQLEKDRAELKKAQEQLEKDREELRKAQEQLEKDLEELRKAREQLEKERAELQKAREQLEKDREELRKAQEQLEKDRAELQKTQEQLEKDRAALAQLEKELEELRKAQKQLEKDREELRKAQEQLEKDREELRKAQEQLEKDREELRKAQEQLKKEQEELRKAQEQLRLEQEAFRAEKEAAATPPLESEDWQREIQRGIEKQQAILDQYSLRSRIIASQSSAFENSGLNITINRDTGNISTPNFILFDAGSSELSDEGKQFLDAFIPLYLEVLMLPEYESNISEVIIEGHTDSSFSADMELSRQRAAQVIAYSLQMPALTEAQRAYLADRATFIGRGFTDPVFDENGQINREASRRVELKFQIRDNHLLAETELVEELTGRLIKAGIPASVNQETGDILPAGILFFEAGEDTLTEEGKTFIREFLPVYLKVLMKSGYREQVGMLIIEGTADRLVPDADRLELSQRRAAQVMEYCMQLDLTELQADFLQRKLAAAGRAAADSAEGTGGRTEDNGGAQVTFRIRLKNTDSLTELKNLLQDS